MGCHCKIDHLNNFPVEISKENRLDERSEYLPDMIDLDSAIHFLRADDRKCTQVYESSFELPLCVVKQDLYFSFDLKMKEVDKVVEVSNILANSLPPSGTYSGWICPSEHLVRALKNFERGPCLAALSIILINHPAVH
jgi:hypothetical protein